jgi:hypothetical protein
VSDRFHVPDKDPNYIYRWVNTDERAMLQRKEQGYEVCMFKDPELPALVKGEAESAPGGVARRRGTDLILCKIRKDVFDEKVDSKRRAAHERHAGVIDDMVAQAKDSAEAAMKRAGAQLPSAPLVFKDTAGQFKT